MSEEYEFETTENGKKKKKEPSEVIEVRHVDDRESIKGESDLQAQLERERKKNENLSLIVEAEAQKDFLENRDNLLKKIPENRRTAIEDFIGDDPEKIEQVKASLILAGQSFDEDDDDKAPEKTISGRAVLPDYNPEIKTGRTGYTNPAIQKYSDLYAILRSPTATEEEKAEVEAILDDTFDQIREGLKSRKRGDNYSLPSGVVSHCMKCGMVVEADLAKVPCPYCQYDFSKMKLPRNPKFFPK